MGTLRPIRGKAELGYAQCLIVDVVRRGEALGLSKAPWGKRIIFQWEVEYDKLGIWRVSKEERKFGVRNEDLVSQAALQASHRLLHLGVGSLKMGILFVFITQVCTDSLLDLNTFMSAQFNYLYSFVRLWSYSVNLKS